MLPIRPLVLATLSAASLATFFATQWILLVTLGAGQETDAYFAALVAPQFLIAVACVPATNVLVPLLSRMKPECVAHSVWIMALNLGTMTAVVAIALAATAPIWIVVFAPGFGVAQQSLAITLVQILLAALPGSVVAVIANAGNQAAGRFIVAEASNLIGNVTALLITLLLLPYFGIAAAAWAVVARGLLQASILLWTTGRPIRQESDTTVSLASLWRSIRPLIASNTITKADPIIDRALLSTASPGILSLFQLAQAIHLAFVEIANRSWFAPALPDLARDAKAHRTQLSMKLTRLLVTTGIGVLVITVLIAIAGKLVLSLIFESSRFLPRDVDLIWQFLIGLSGVLIGASIGQVAANYYYARGDTSRPARIGVFTFTLFAPIKIGAFAAWGPLGLVVTCSAYYLANALILLKGIMLGRRAQS